MKLYITTDSTKKGQIAGKHWEDNFYPKVYRSVKKAQQYCPQDGGVYTIYIDCANDKLTSDQIGKAFKYEISAYAERLGIRYSF